MMEKETVSLMFIVTLGCNSECPHCCLSCGMGKKDICLTGEEMVRYIEKVHNSKYQVDSVIFSGGEATLYQEEICLPMTVASTLGLHVDLRTNAYWATSQMKAYEVLKGYKDRGLQQLGLSYDWYHCRVPVEYIQNAIKASRELELRLYVDWIGKETHADVLEYMQLEESELRAVIPPLRVGKATLLSDSHFELYPREYYKGSASCKGEHKILTIFPGGYASLHPCCWVNPALIRKIGNNGWLNELDKEMENSQMVQYLYEQGVGGLIEKAEREQPQLLKTHYSYQCEACYDLLGALFPDEIQDVPEYIKELKEPKNRRKEKALVMV